jgi:hypothetical protein
LGEMPLTRKGITAAVTVKPDHNCHGCQLWSILSAWLLDAIYRS